MSIGRLSKAKNTDMYSYVTMKYDVPPALKAGSTLAGAQTVFQSNPHASNYARVMPSWCISRAKMVVR